ncbi:Uncharacterized protein SCF082_LOCUS22969, partial [Durusdinium trenchii]
MEYDNKSQSLEIVYRMFSDDLEEALTGHSQQSVDILNPNEKKKVDLLVESYLNEKMTFWVDGEKQAFEFLGSELDNGALWCFMEIKSEQAPEKIEVDNSVMLELFDDQINLVHFNQEDN